MFFYSGHAHHAGNVDRAVCLCACGRTDFEMHGKAEASGMRGDGLQRVVVGAAQTPLFAIGQMDAHTGEFVAVREVEQIHRTEAAVREVRQVGVGVCEERDGVEPREEFTGERCIQRGQGGALARVEIATEEFGESGLEGVHLVFRERRGAAVPSVRTTLPAAATIAQRARRSGPCPRP